MRLNGTFPMLLIFLTRMRMMGVPCPRRFKFLAEGQVRSFRAFATSRIRHSES